MSLSSIKIPSIHAKLNGMYAQKIKKSDLEELIKQNTTKQAIALLKSLNDEFKELEENPRRINIKILLDNILIKDIKKIYRLLNSKDKEVFLNFISIYEVKCIKSVFRKLSSGSVINERTNEVENWVTKIFRNLIGIENSKNYEEFKVFLNKTPYYSIFEYEQNDIQKINIFEIENKLDKLYFENIMKVAKKYNNNLENMIGKQIDLNNIVWINRVKKHYDFSDEQIRRIIINKNYKLKKIDIENLIQANNEDEVKNILKNTFYTKYVNFDDEGELEEQVDKYLYNVYKKCFRSNIFDISTVYAYINMTELENNDIMNVVEGIRYHLSRDEIRKKLVR